MAYYALLRGRGSPRRLCERKQPTPPLAGMGIEPGRRLDMTFTEFLNERQADVDTVQQAFRLYLSEQTNDLPPEAMRARLTEAANDSAELKRRLKALETDSVALEQAARACFEYAWTDESQEPSIRAAFKYAKRKLPVIEVGILALVVMYGMYLIATDGGKTEEEKVKIQKADGT